MINKQKKIITTFFVVLAFSVVVLGAYTRLTNAGLGCPDWPGCYGHMVLPSVEAKLVSAQQAFPATPIESTKAWTEMIHRYLAGSLALCIFATFFYAWKRKFKQDKFPFLLPNLLLGVVVWQALLGMWTVTLKLLPVVVMGHLLGGLCTVSLLWWFRLQALYPRETPKYNNWIKLGIVILIMQIALGGWVSSNYAGLACVGFPYCNGKFIPSLNISEAFNLFAPIGDNYQGGLLSIDARVTIQVVHRLFAMLVATYWLSLSIFLIRKKEQILQANIVLILLFTQFSLGVLNVIDRLPLSLAVMHNACAVLLLLACLRLLYGSKRVQK